MTTTLPPVDEDHARDFVFEYSDAKRMAPYRANVILEKALADSQPAPPDEDVSVLRNLRVGRGSEEEEEDIRGQMMERR